MKWPYLSRWIQTDYEYLVIPFGLKNNYIPMKLFNERTYIHQLSIDCVIFGYKETELKVLVPKLDLKKSLGFAWWFY